MSCALSWRATVSDSVADYPELTICHPIRSLGLSYCSLRRIVYNDLDLHP